MLELLLSSCSDSEEDDDEEELELEESKSRAVELEDVEDDSSPLSCVANPERRLVSREWLDTPNEKE